MSFILDALKKSESERQRQSGPALFEVKVAPPRSRFAAWAAGLGALLAINLVVVGWIVLRGSSNRAATVASAAAAQAPGPAAPGAGAAPFASGPGAGGAAQNAPPYAGSASVPLAGPEPPRGVDTRYGVANAATAGASPAGEPANPPASPASDLSASRPAGEPSSNADDLAPAVEPQRPSAASDGQVVRSTESGLPTYQDVAAEPGANLPDLRLDLHAWSAQPDQRFVFLNMMKLHEGDSMPTGVRVETITPDGVILSYHGAKFVLQRQP